MERRRGAARLLEAYLNRPQVHTPSSPSRSSPSSTLSSVFSSSSTASTLATPQSTFNLGSSSSWGQGDSSKYSPTRLRNNPFSVRIGSYPEPQWLLTCANEGRYTPKIVHLDVNMARIRSDKDLAMALREHYNQVNRRWFRILKLRGLTTIDFVQVRNEDHNTCLSYFIIRLPLIRFGEGLSGREPWNHLSLILQIITVSASA